MTVGSTGPPLSILTSIGAGAEGAHETSHAPDNAAINAALVGRVQAATLHDVDRRAWQFAGALALVSAGLSGCVARGASDRFEFAEIIMGVEARITLYAGDSASARAAARAAFDRLNELDAVMSDYRRDSELMQVCRGPVGVPRPVSADLYAVLDRARMIAEASDGAFDVTVAPVVKLWREARKVGRRPDPEALAAARARCGWRALVLDPETREVTLTRPGMEIDLGGIGKGFAADAAKQCLAVMGAPRCLVDLGGDIAVGAPPLGREGWKVAIECRALGRSPPVLHLANMSIAQSSDDIQHVEIDGVRYSHILDPATGLGVTARRSVTVLAPDGATADALASAVSVLGADAGLRLVERFPGASAIVETLVEDHWETRRSERAP